ncbi:MAG TPA: cytochrome d ubiquinol oxidase subunit II [Xanthomonadaceae bacterium]|nr:cytochrome d ubiquinol oxidase subunit II [Xanthomonadaceae bacterium]
MEGALLPMVWAAVIATAVLLYVVFDGFDLGVGILFPLRAAEVDRDLMMNSVAPFWDGNETWLVLGGGGLWVAFPLAFSIVMPALYLPVIVMLLALIFRGVAFEFRWVAKPQHRLWDIAFAAGSTTAAFANGVILGGFLQGITVRDGLFAGGAFDWLTPFALVCGAGVAVGYALLGACWLVYKIEGELAQWARKAARWLLLGVLAFIALVSLWTPLTIPEIAARWFAWPNLLWLSPVPLLTGVLALLAWRGLARGRDLLPFLCSVGLFVLGFVGLAISTYPYLVPRTLTIWDTAAHPESQMFMLVGVVILLPVIIGYFVFVYWTFRGKLRPGEGYH